MKRSHWIGWLLAWALAAPAAADPVIWADWTSATPGAVGSATGVLNIPGSPVMISYSGEVAFAQTGGGTNYWVPSTPYTSPAVDNPPPDSDIIGLSIATSKTLTFSAPIDNLFFAVVSLNVNGYEFDSDFEIVSSGCGFWGCGGFVKVPVAGGKFQLNADGAEPHGVIRFTQAVSSITWTSLTNEFWNGFSVGTYGLADVPEPATSALAGLAIAGAALRVRRSRR